MAVVKRKTALKIRKIHRYLGIFIGIQFLMWTVSGLYFSWTDIDEIQGDQFRTQAAKPEFKDLKSPQQLQPSLKISSLELRNIASEPYYWINGNTMVHARTGKIKDELSSKEALQVAQRHMKKIPVKDVQKITNTDEHYEYRGGPLPAYVISYDTDENINAYVSARDGAFQTLRHRDWRWFDFLWMTHTMDYEGRDDINNLALRIFSLMGLVTVFSGFLLWYISSPRVIKFLKKLRK